MDLIGSPIDASVGGKSHVHGTPSCERFYESLHPALLILPLKHEKVRTYNATCYNAIIHLRSEEAEVITEKAIKGNYRLQISTKNWEETTRSV